MAENAASVPHPGFESHLCHFPAASFRKSPPLSVACLSFLAHQTGMPTHKALRGGGGGGVRGRCQRRRRGRADTTGDSRRVPSCFAISQEAEELGVPSPPSGSGGGGARPPGGQGFVQPSSGAKRRRRRRAPARPPSARSTASMALRARPAWPPLLLSLLSPLCWATPGAGE